MSRGLNAQLAVDEYLLLLQQKGWSKSDAWHGIALLLLSCDVWESGGYRRLNTLRGHASVPDVVVYRERNDFKVSTKGKPNAVVQRAEQLSQYLAQQLGVPRTQLCNTIGTFYRTPIISQLQPHNIVGHSFRSICVEILKHFGDPGITYEEEVDPTSVFPGWQFSTRSRKAKLDIMARRNSVPVALISARWRLRHDRIDVPEEMRAYGPAARTANQNCALYGLVGEFAPDRLEKLLVHAPPTPNPILNGAVHFAPDLISKGLGLTGRLSQLKDLAWLIDQTFLWR